MAYSLGHPSSSKLLGAVRLLFKEKRIFYALRTHVVFVCGGSKKSHLRSRFIKFVRTAKTEFAVFRAEDALDNLFASREPELTNLSSLEALIAEAFDSVVIFPESPGSYAELGYFSAVAQIRKKTLVVNSDAYQDDSFLTLGPIAAISEDSLYKPTIILNAKAAVPRFGFVLTRLGRFTSKRKHREPFRYTSYERMGTKDRLFVIAEIVRIFRVIDLEGITQCLSAVFGKIDPSDLKKFVAILQAANFIAKTETERDYYVPGTATKRFFEYEHAQLEDLNASIISYYKNHHPDRFEIHKRLP